MSRWMLLESVGAHPVMLPPASQVGVILVEEAGEVLEAHVLAALTPSTKQLIMIGDHQQLRPKVESYNLTVSGGKVRPGPCSSVAVKEGGMPQRMRAHIACSGWWWVGGWAHARAVTRSFGVRRMRPLAHTRPCTAPAISGVTALQAPLLFDGTPPSVILIQVRGDCRAST
jgi:hypothetical protein